jgi:hypothetical protein
MYMIEKKKFIRKHLRFNDRLKFADDGTKRILDKIPTKELNKYNITDQSII